MFEERLEKILSVADEIESKKDELIEASIRDLGFTYKDSAYELELTSKRLRNFSRAKEIIEERSPICDLDEEVALILPYNGVGWLNIAIASIYMAGNPVRVRFSARSENITKLTERIYKGISENIKFDYRPSEDFMRWAIDHPKVKAICMFGSDEIALRYDEDIRKSKKKFIFEGPGNDPFIVLNDANLENAALDLKDSKYRYSGQACVSPERILVHDEIYDDFLELYVELTNDLVVGDPSDPDTDVAPVTSDRAVESIENILNDAMRKGGEIICGGKIEGNLVYPTIVADATQDMFGMKREIFGPVSFVTDFKSTKEAIQIAKNNRYGLRASIYGYEDAETVRNNLKGKDYLHTVKSITLGKFGTVSVNKKLAEAWKDALVTKPIGGYGYSGWVRDFNKVKQGPKLFSLETST